MSFKVPHCAVVACLLVGACGSTAAPDSSGSGGSNATGSGGKSATGGSSGSGTGGSPGSSTTCTPGTVRGPGAPIMGPFGTITLSTTTPGEHEYFLQVNEWNATDPQAIVWGGDSFFKITQQLATKPTTGGPTGYPSLWIGANGGRSTRNSGLPKAVSALTTVPTMWVWNDNGTLANPSANSYNAAYDVWFSTLPTGDPAASTPSGGFLMVWYHKPSDAQPIGSVKYNSVSIPGVPGTWNAWVGTNAGKPCISYVSNQDIMSLSFDLNAFIKDAVAKGSVQNTWSLTNIFSGFEIWRGGVNLQTTGFCAEVN